MSNTSHLKKRRFFFNIEGVIFAIIALYILFSVVSFMRRDQIRFYEVREGSLVKENQFTGLILRNEKAYAAKKSGYIHFTVMEGRRVSKNAELYTLDETGNLENYLSEHPELLGSLNEKQIMELRQRLENFSRSFEDNRFYTLYSFQSGMDNNHFSFSGEEGVKQLNSILSNLGIAYTTGTAEEAGVVSYILDGFESFKESDLAEEVFKKTDPKKEYVQGGSKVEEGSLIYKIISASKWNVYFPLSEEENKELENKHKVILHFDSQNLDLSGELFLVRGKDGKNFGKVELSNYQDYFLEDRFVAFSLKEREENGLKIPASAVVKKDFYVVPNEFLSTLEDGSQGFYRKESDGNLKFIPTEIYRKDQQYAYIDIPKNQDSSVLKTGDVLIKQESTDSFIIGPTKSLEGVYNINKGYAVFRQIVPLEKNDEYIIVKKDTSSGIEVYDHIVLQGDMVSDGQLIFQ